MSKSVQKNQLRVQVRQIRQSLSIDCCEKYSKQLAKTLSQWPVLRSAKRIAGYLAQDQELDLANYFEQCWTKQQHIFLPILKPLPPNRLWFAPYQPDSRLVTNKYHIMEPDLLPNHCLRVSQLDAVLFPLVAFDQAKNRIGMGGGFYDRTFAHLAHTTKRPHFIGIAYEQQKVSSINSEHWDLPLDAIVTPERIYR